MLVGFQPGNLEQDIYTLPLEAGLIGMMNEYYIPQAKPLWPFDEESTDYSERKSSRHSRTLGVMIGLPVAAGTLVGLAYSSPKFKVWMHLRGWMHAQLLTEVATSFAKNSFQRKRPFYDAEAEQEKVTGAPHLRADDRKSFFSGHSSHTFAFATYASALLWDYAPHKAIFWAATPLLMGGATAVAKARVDDGQHHVLDVVVGGIVGTAIAATVESRVNTVSEEQSVAEQTAVEWRPIASTQWNTELQNRMYILGANVRF